MKFTVTAGHGEPVNPFSQYDPGATYGGYTEAGLMAELRDMVAAALRGMGHEVMTDGEGKVNKALTYAISLIPGSRVAVDLHTNAFTNPAASGVVVVSLPSRKADAQRLAWSVATVLGLPLRGERGWMDQSDSHRGKLGFVGAGGLILETFFLSNPLDLSAYLERRQSVAAAIAAALANA